MEPRIARHALIAALLAGVAADGIFDRAPLGVGVPIATAAVLAMITWFGPHRRPADPIDWWLPAVALAASVGPALRTDPTVILLDLGLIAASVTAWSVAVSGIAVTRRTAAVITTLGAQAGLALAIGPAWLVARVGADGAFARGRSQLGGLAPVVRGTVVAVPVVAGFALLLGSADAVFGRVLEDALRFPVDLDEAWRRAAFAVIAAAVLAGPLTIAAAAGGALRWAGLRPIEPESEPATTSGPLAATAPADAARSGATEALVVLLAVDLLFAGFAAVQLVYLFGGRDTLAAIGMTYSDYARQGYFQLVGVVGLAGLLAIGAHQVVGRTRSFQVAALTLLGLTSLILASAAVRLALYQGAYGWTELRFLVAASIGWLGACLALAIVLLAADRMRWLPHGLAMSAIAATLVVSAIGPQAFVMRENLARVLDPTQVAPGGEAGIDLAYGMTLGDDAIPDLVAALAVVPARQGSILLRQLELRREELEREAATAGPLSWNLAREQARAALARLATPSAP